LLVSWIVAVYFTSYLGVKLLPEIRPVEGGHDAIYGTSRYERFRRAVGSAVNHRRAVALGTVGALVLAGLLLAVAIPKQFFPSSDRPELLVDVYMPKGTSVAVTQKVVERLEADIGSRPGAV